MIGGRQARPGSPEKAEVKSRASARSRAGRNSEWWPATWAATVGNRRALEASGQSTIRGKAPSTTLPLFAAGWGLLHDRQGCLPADIFATLWQVALHFEQGDAADSAQSMAQAEKTPVVDTFLTVTGAVKNPCTLRLPIGVATMIGV